MLEAVTLASCIVLSDIFIRTYNLTFTVRTRMLEGRSTACIVPIRTSSHTAAKEERHKKSVQPKSLWLIRRTSYFYNRHIHLPLAQSGST